MKKGLLKKIFAISIVGVMSLSMMACGSKTNKSIDGNNNELVVGLSADYAPYEFHAMIDGKDTVVGFDVKLAEEIAKDMGKTLKIKEMKFDSLLGALSAGQIDMIISGMNPDPERAKKVDFSDIYYTAQHAVLVKKDDANKYQKAEDLKDAKIGAQMGSTQADIAKDVIKAKNPTFLSNVNNLILELKSGKIDALVTEKPVGQMAVKTNNELALSNITFEDASGGNAVAVKKGEKELVEKVNKTIKKLKDNGKLDEFIVEANELSSKQIEEK